MAKGRVRLPRTRGSSELGKVASRSAKQGLWLADRKRDVGEDRSRLPPRGTIGEAGRKATDRTKKRKYTDLGLDLGQRNEQVVCHASVLVMTEEACPRR